MNTIFKIVLSAFLLIFFFPAFSQEIGKRFSVSANYSLVMNLKFGKYLHNGGANIGYNVNNYFKPFVGIDYYVINGDDLYYKKAPFNKMDLHLGLEGRFFKTKMVNLVLQTKFGVDAYSNARNKPVTNLRIQDKFYVYDPFDDGNGNTNLSDGIYRYSLFWSNSLLLSLYYKSFEVKLGPGYQLGVFKYGKGMYEKQVVNSYTGTISLTYYF